MSEWFDPVLDRLNPGDDVLDVGCIGHSLDPSSERWLHGEINEKCRNVVGIDTQEDVISKLNRPNIDVRYGDAESFDIDGKFDNVIAAELIEHISNPGLFLERAHQHLYSYGRLIITTPNPFAFVHIRRAFSGGVTINSEHTCWYSEATIRELLNRSNFGVETLELMPPTGSGLTATLHSLGFETIGATHLIIVAYPINNHKETDARLE